MLRSTEKLFYLLLLYVYLMYLAILEKMVCLGTRCNSDIFMYRGIIICRQLRF